MPQKRERARLPLSLKRKRERLPPVINWEGAIKLWTIKFIHKNKWRCDSIHTVDDLLQDAYLIYLKICDKYPRVIDSRLFMALYKRSISNKTHDMALYMKRKRGVHQETSRDVCELFTSHIGELSNDGYINALLAEAPEELRIALHMFANNPETLRELPNVGHRQNINAQLRRLLGFTGGFDFIKELKTLFT